jgi:Flp pilus assembly protein TadD
VAGAEQAVSGSGHEDYVHRASQNLGETAARLGNYDEAVIQFKKSLSSMQRLLSAHAAHSAHAGRPRKLMSEAHVNIGSTFVLLGRVQEAAAKFHEAYLLAPKHIDENTAFRKYKRSLVNNEM